MTIAASVESYLRAHGVRFELSPHRTTGSTRESAVAAHVPEDHIAKAVMLRDAKRDAMAVIPGSAWLQLNALNRETNRDFRLDEDLKTLANLYFESLFFDQSRIT